MTNTMLHIKTATVADIPLIQQLTDQIWRPTYKPLLSPEQIEYMINLMYSTSALTRQLTELQHVFLLLYDDGTPIGFASYGAMETPGVFKLHKIYLHPGHQGKGVGRFLLNAVIENVRAQQAHTLELDVKRDNKARFFYEKQGFLILREKDTDIGNGYWMTDYVMQKSL